MLRNHDIGIEFDEATGSYFILWAPCIASSGATEHEALEDLRTVAHFGVDTMINLKISDIKERKEV
jgi:hypothetical protein